MSWDARIVQTVEAGEPLAAQVNTLLAAQRAAWPLLAAGTAALVGLRKRVLECHGSHVVVQANPGRRASVHARVDTASVAARPCFLCPENLPAEECGVGVGELVALPNPFPIVSDHVTIPSREHRPQRLAGREVILLDLSRALGPAMLVFYNGPRCGASAPDHFHFQAGSSAGVPLLGEIEVHGPDVEMLSRFGRRGLILRGADREDVAQRLIGVLTALQSESSEEPLVNVVAVHRDGVYNVFVFPRAVHRPCCFFAEGQERVSVSPASLEMMGFLVVADVDHFDRIDARVAYEVFAEVCVGEEHIAAVFEEVS